jgi:hypothetical protein
MVTASETDILIERHSDRKWNNFRRRCNIDAQEKI